MEYKIIIESEAEFEIFEAAHYYENIQYNLGIDFISKVEEAISALKTNVEAYPFIYKNIRRILIKRFPYGIFYTVHEDNIKILAVFHQKRKPIDWNSRLT